VKNHLGFRGWFYFRTGWSTYFAFIFAAVNTLTVTYFLAIDNYPFLKEIFPTFVSYVVVLSLVGVPLLTLIGYLHYKKTASFRAESDVYYETNPYFNRMVKNTEMTLPICLVMVQLLTKISNNEILTKNEIEEITELKNKLEQHIKNNNIDT
jgi:hypothetical protein